VFCVYAADFRQSERAITRPPVTSTIDSTQNSTMRAALGVVTPVTHVAA
jgi:hypothetical protein